MDKLQQTIIERLTAKKAKNLTQCDNLKNKLKQQNDKDSEKQALAYEKIIELKKEPLTRDLSVQTLQNISLASACGGMAIGLGLGTLIDQSADSTFLGTIGGLLVGGLPVAAANVYSYVNKPLSNSIRKSLIKANDRKIKKLENKKLLRDYSIFCLNQYDQNKTPSYEAYLDSGYDNEEETSM